MRPESSLEDINKSVCDIALDGRPRRAWLIAISIAFALTVLLVVSVWWLLLKGVGIWGLNVPVVWAFAIINYVWWIAIGMGGTFISAALYLLRADWRAAINRYAESMTLFAVCVAGIFPILHLGRPWFVYWLFPYPNKMNLWPQWRSSLVWDFAAILAYLLFSLLFWYGSMLPDLATLRDRAHSRGRRLFYGLLALGWRGEARQWLQLERWMLLMAALAVPLVFSVHSMVALDFSEAILPGWHSTIFPPFFVAGALHSGFAMVLLLGVLLRVWFRMEAVITSRHLDNIARLLLTTSLVMAYSYASEIFTAYYSGEATDIATVEFRFSGAYAWVYWTSIFCNVVAVQILWWRSLRERPLILAAIASLVLIGMWFERLMLVVTSLYRDFLPSSWGMYYPTFWDITTLLGALGLFAFLFLLFVRLLPIVSMHELRKLHY